MNCTLRERQGIIEQARSTRSRWTARWLAAMAIGFVAATASTAYGQLEFERPPIDYQNAPTNDPVARLQRKLDAGEVKLQYDTEHGYLASVLELLGVPQSSQVLVFSKTSFQLRRIDPRHPRAVYFNDDNYIGWVQDGDVVEVASVDPHQGAIFYTLSLEPTDKPQFLRDKGQCLTCHASSRTQGVPGHLVRSVYTDLGGQPVLGSGTFTTNHASPFRERWGGWYVSGTHGDMRHMGNVLVSNRREPEQLDVEKGANVRDLSKIVDTAPYLSPHSDIVSLMVLEHQSQMHNMLTLASYETRTATHYDRVMNEALERPADHRSETTERRLSAAADKVVRYMLFCDEFKLESPVAGTSDFAKEFAQTGPRDSKGRSLRDFDLERRMFKHPCSFLIYSEAFDSLPPPVKSLVVKRLLGVLRGEDKSPEFAHLTAEDRLAILEILRETKPSLWPKEESAG